LYISSNTALTSLSGLENITSVGGYLSIQNNDVLTSLSGLDNITSVGGILSIGNNDVLTSLGGLENLTSVGGNWGIQNNAALTSLCSLYKVVLAGNELHINSNAALSPDTASALDIQLRNNGFDGTSNIFDNGGTVQVFCDNDKDTVYDDIDNCPNKCNPIQLDADGDGLGDACDITPGCGGCGQPSCEVLCDLDADGILNITDNCPNTCNTQQLDADGDTAGDVCDDTPGCGGCGETACEVASCPD
jgi:phosphotransferase system IIB component